MYIVKFACTCTYCLADRGHQITFVFSFQCPSRGKRICWGGMLPHSAAQRFHLQLHHFYVDYIFRVFLRAGRTSLYNVVETESCRPHACASAVDDLGTKGISRQASLDLREIFTFIVNAPAPRLECLRRETFERCRTPMMKSSEPPRR